MSTQSSEERGGSTTVQAYVRGQRALMRIQLAIGLIAMLGVAFLGWRLWDWQKRLDAQGRELAEQQQQIDEQTARINHFKEGAGPFLQGMTAFGRGGEVQYVFALSQLQQATQAAPEEPVFRRGLASVQFAARLYDEAAQSGERLMELSTPDDINRAPDQINLALAYYCGGDSARARDILTPDFLQANAGVVRQQAAEAQGCLADPLIAIANIPSDATNEAQSAGAFVIRRIFLHIAHERDRADAVAVARTLCASGAYSVAGIELVDSAAYPRQLDVRYYYEPQVTQAGEIAALVTRAATEVDAPQGWRGAPYVRQLTGYPNLPPERVEVWLPLSPERDVQTGQRNFRC